MHGHVDSPDETPDGAVPGDDVVAAVCARLAVVAFSLGASTAVTVALSSVLFR
jgi:hypothetical protein